MSDPKPPVSLTNLPPIKTPSGASVTFFSSSSECAEHVRNHLLTMPEARAFAMACPNLGIPWNDVDALWRLAQEQTGNRDDLFTIGYRNEIEAAAREADRLGWHARADERKPDDRRLGPSNGTLVEVWFSPRGVAAIAGYHTLWTAYIPGAGSPAQVELAKRSDAKTKAQSRSLSVMQHARRTRGERDKAPETVRKGWSADQHLFFDVFRPALQHIRSLHHVPGNHTALGLLKDSLPSPSEKFQEWQTYCAKASILISPVQP